MGDRWLFRSLCEFIWDHEIKCKLVFDHHESLVFLDLWKKLTYQGVSPPLWGTDLLSQKSAHVASHVLGVRIMFMDANQYN